MSGPGGVGKGTVCAALRKSTNDLVYSVSATTRAPRQGEVDGVNYFFKTKEQFLQMIAEDELLEWAEYVGNYYGTPRYFVEEVLNSGKDIILEIEVLQVDRNYARRLGITPPETAQAFTLSTQQIQEAQK